MAFVEECRGNVLIRLLPISFFEFDQLRPSLMLALLSDGPSETFIIRILRVFFGINIDILSKRRIYTRRFSGGALLGLGASLHFLLAGQTKVWPLLF